MASELSISENVLTDIASVFSIADVNDKGYDLGDYKKYPTALEFLASTIRYAEGSISSEAAEKSLNSFRFGDSTGGQAAEERPGVQFLTVLPVLQYFVGDPEPYGGKSLEKLVNSGEAEKRLKQLKDFNETLTDTEAIQLTDTEIRKLSVACLKARVALPPEEINVWTWRTYRAFCILWHRYKLARPDEYPGIPRINDALSGLTLGFSEA